MGINPYAIGAANITQFQISTVEGDVVETQLPLGGIGISRFAFDELFYQRAKRLGVNFYFEKVNQMDFRDDSFYLTTNSKTYTAKITIGAYGKRSILDKKLEREFSFKKQSWLAVKGHYRHPDFPEHLVGLHNFEGGYGGLSKTESGAVNFCYLASYQNFKKYRNIVEFNQQVVAENPFLKKFLNESDPIFEHPMTIAQISFDKKESVINHMLMCGDTAGLIHPLCGNGMAMAIHSAKIASELVTRFMMDSKFDREKLEREYDKVWKRTFSRRLWFGRKLQSILLNKSLVSMGIRTIGKSDTLLKYIIAKTHGDLIV
jgi:flavin-dependent dehydrogenase